MLLMTIALAMLAQGPSPERAILVSGPVELTRREAERSARAAATRVVRRGLAARFSAALAEHAPSWLPTFKTAELRRAWLAAPARAKDLEVLEQHTRMRDHGWTKSYQTELLVQASAASLRGIERGCSPARLHDIARGFLIQCGGIMGLWTLLGLAYAWLDWLSRGYMSWRLRFLAAGIGVTAPALVMLF